MLILSRAVADQIRKHAAEEYPDECCGLLIGKSGPQAGVVVCEAPRLPNLCTASRQSRYLGDPDEQLRLILQVRERSLDMVGSYHSHPDIPACPSAFDLQNAWPGYMCLIVSVYGGTAEDMQAWVMNTKEEGFEQVEIRWQNADL
ncbi:MAG: Mov34/MPN/PAD-1 family protein [Armatimonadota bacterium]